MITWLLWNNPHHFGCIYNGGIFFSNVGQILVVVCFFNFSLPQPFQFFNRHPPPSASCISRPFFNMTIYLPEGYSLINRIIIYTSTALAPAQYISGVGSNCFSNLGFLTFNIYSQVLWYRHIIAWSSLFPEAIAPFSLLLPHFNIIYSISYVAGVSSRSGGLAVLLWLGTSVMLIINTILLWSSWKHMAVGYGEYEFFFFGWRTLTPKWHKVFFLMWNVSSTILCGNSIIWAAAMARLSCKQSSIVNKFVTKFRDRLGSGMMLVAIFGGVLFMLIGAWPFTIFFFKAALKRVLQDSFSEAFGLIESYIFLQSGIWPFILWTELIFQRNEIVSATDETAVWLFIFQVVAMIIPAYGCLKGRKSNSSDSDDSGYAIQRNNRSLSPV